MNFAKSPVPNDALTTALASAPGLAPAINSTAVLSNPLLQSSWQGASAIALIDASVWDYQTLVAGIAPGTEVHLLDSSQDAITQITNMLLGRHNISSLHIVSHGEAGGLDFGSSVLNLTDLPQYAAQLQSWSNALTDDADLLLYGCNVAQSELGQAFVQILSQLTGMDVAASDHLTGSAILGGDWELEFKAGEVETDLAFQSETTQRYIATLDATYHNLAGGIFSQDWTNIGLITANDDWSIVPSIIGYLGQDLTTVIGTDPQTILTPNSAVANDIDVIANQTNPGTLTSGGVAEFQIADPTVAFQGSGTGDAPYLLIHLNTTGVATPILVSYNLRDIDGSTDNAIQQVALQYRVGTTVILPTSQLLMLLMPAPDRAWQH